MATGCAEPGPIYRCFCFEHQYQLMVYLKASKRFRENFCLAVQNGFIYLCCVYLNFCEFLNVDVGLVDRNQAAKQATAATVAAAALAAAVASCS